jgi:hypothetical protein
LSEDRGRFIGEWKYNMRHGYGIQQWHDGSVYDGEWQEDKRDGHGTMTWADGQSYTGTSFSYTKLTINKANGKTVEKKEKESKSGLMVVNILENIETATCMELGLILGLTAICT